MNASLDIKVTGTRVPASYLARVATARSGQPTTAAELRALAKSLNIPTADLYTAHGEWTHADAERVLDARLNG